eukprot:3302681-Amphidinium_carterae.1
MDEDQIPSILVEQLSTTSEASVPLFMEVDVVSSYSEESLQRLMKILAGQETVSTRYRIPREWLSPFAPLEHLSV